MKALATPLVKTAEQARDIAIEWQSNLGDESMSWGDLIDWQAYFEELGNKFDLTDEFRENGII